MRIRTEEIRDLLPWPEPVTPDDDDGMACLTNVYGHVFLIREAHVAEVRDGFLYMPKRKKWFVRCVVCGVDVAKEAPSAADAIVEHMNSMNGGP